MNTKRGFAMKAVAAAVAAILLAGPAAAFKWDPIGDIQNPGRIVRNIERETKNVGREIDRIRLETNAQAAAPAFEAWLNESRNSASRGGTSPIPSHIRQQLQGFYDNDILNRARYKVGDSGVFNLANLSIRYGEAAAVTLVDVIVFKSAADAQNNVALWAHELKHVQQFRDWGVRDFAIRYIRSWNGVEDEAYAAQNQFVAQQNRARAQVQSPPQYSPRPMIAQRTVANICATPYGGCSMGMAIDVGASCYCPSMRGPIWGVAR